MNILNYRAGLILLAACITVFTVVYAQQSAESQENVEYWNVRCVDVKSNDQADGTGAKEQSCEMFQRLSVKDSGQRILEFAIAKTDSKTGVSRGAVILPLGILVKPGVLVQIDEGDKFRFDIHHCTSDGCVAFVDMNKEVLKTFQKGAVAHLLILSADGKKIQLDLNLTGFSKAYKQLQISELRC